MSDLPSYKNPPLEEVAFGCQFSPLGKWRIPYTGKLWDLFIKDYPIIEHAAPIVLENTLVPYDNATGLLLPRVWFINNSESRLIQFQQDRFHYNWRKRDEELEYPRYEELASKFSEYIAILEKFVNENSLGVIEPQSYELTYINHISPERDAMLADELSRFLSDFNWTSREDRFLPKPRNMAWNTIFPFPDQQGTLNIKLSQGRKTVEGPQLIILELTAKGINPTKALSSHSEWFALAHEWIVRGFTDLTTEAAQQEWGREK